jgi:hypothetical protein
MKNKIIFIHVPKTGGTTINTAIHKSYWQTVPDFYYRHILAETKTSNSGDIFAEANLKKFSHFDIVMMLRHPVDRAISEYHFMKERKDFINLLKPIPKSFAEFVNNPQTHNYVISFLTGGKIYSQKRPQPIDLKRIKKAIETIPIHVGIFEQYGESLNYFSKNVDIEWKKNVEVKRITFVRPKVNDISDEIRDDILKFNNLDLELYNFCLDRFNAEKPSFSTNKIKFDISKYNHVLPYMANYPFFGFCMENKKYIERNNDFFKQLSHYFIDVKRISDGYQLTKAWNATFVNFIKNAYPNSNFYYSILEAYNSEKDPLKQTIEISKAMDIFFKRNKNEKLNYYKPLHFDEFLVVIPKMEFKEIFKGIFSKKS